MGECIVKVVIELDPGNAAGYVLLQTFMMMTMMMMLLLASVISTTSVQLQLKGSEETSARSHLS
jgi:hypothetical protein